MELNTRATRSIRFMVAVALGLIASGCAVHSSTVGKPIRQRNVDQIQKGVTTKTEILDWFGQPALIMKPGDEHPDYTSEDVPPSASPYFFSFGGMTHRNLDNIFELFTGSHDIRDNHRIYMYTYSRSGGGMLAVPFFSTYGTDMRTDCLLILLDEHTSIVLDYLMDRQK